MKKSIINMLLLSVIFSFYSNGQEMDYYYGNNKRIYLEKVDNFVLLQIKEEYIEWFNNQHHDESIILKQLKSEERGFFLIEFKSNKSKLLFIDNAKNMNFILGELPVYKMFGSKATQSFDIITDEFIVKLKDELSEFALTDINNTYDVSIVDKNNYNEFLLRVNDYNNLSSVRAANIYFESELTEWSHPNFISSISPDSDPYYSEQYYLKNTGQGGGLAGNDINIEPVWNYTKGSSDIIVAVIDDGVMQHEDFYSGQLITGYSPHGGTAPPYDNSHGMNCAGIIGGNHNEIGIRGISPNVKIMPIRFVYDIIQDWQIAYSIDWAHENGADVLSNSWGFNMQGEWRANIAAAIARAQSLGRGNKGSLVVFAAGNTGSFTKFPANVPGVVSVGAVDKHNDRWYYSPVDNGVDIVAPSGDLDYQNCDYRGDMWTTDRDPGRASLPPQVCST